MKFKFEGIHTTFANPSKDTGNRVIVECEEELLTDVLEQFELFLRGCGYYFEGTLDIVSDEIEESK